MKIIAVTSCPVGMAHTYMASAALKKTAKQLGHQILVETQGSMGIRDRISPKDIKEADLFINAADVAIEEGERFQGLPTFRTSTSKLIKKCQEELQKALDSLP
ncbi:MAG: PTS fructose transporter subunit IIB [Anaerolineales bacterium]